MISRGMGACASPITVPASGSYPIDYSTGCPAACAFWQTVTGTPILPSSASAGELADLAKYGPCCCSPNWWIIGGAAIIAILFARSL